MLSACCLLWYAGCRASPEGHDQAGGLLASSSPRPRASIHANNQTMAKLLHKVGPAVSSLHRSCVVSHVTCMISGAHSRSLVKPLDVAAAGAGQHWAGTLVSKLPTGLRLCVLQAIGVGTGSAPDPSAYEAYMAHFQAAPPHVLRDCLVLDTGKAAISLDDVEPAADIMKRFCTGGMSLGAISREVRWWQGGEGSCVLIWLLFVGCRHNGHLFSCYLFCHDHSISILRVSVLGAEHMG